VQVGSVSAEDKDSNEFNAFLYSFQSGDTVTEWFSIDESRGLLTTRQPLDRELKDTHSLVVKAYDKKMSTMSSLVSITVQVYIRYSPILQLRLCRAVARRD